MLDLNRRFRAWAAAVACLSAGAFSACAPGFQYKTNVGLVKDGVQAASPAQATVTAAAYQKDGANFAAIVYVQDGEKTVAVDVPMLATAQFGPNVAMTGSGQFTPQTNNPTQRSYQAAMACDDAACDNAAVTLSIAENIQGVMSPLKSYLFRIMPGVDAPELITHDDVGTYKNAVEALNYMR